MSAVFVGADILCMVATTILGGWLLRTDAWNFRSWADYTLGSILVVAAALRLAALVHRLWT